MKIIDTISVNPGKNALGHVESSNDNIFRNKILNVNKETSYININSILFPTIGQGLGEYRKYEIPLRTLFATILIITGISMLTISLGIHGTGYAICCLAFGFFLAIGFLTRPIMMGATVFYFISGALELRNGYADIAVFSLMFGSLIFGLIGAGKYSCDSLLRHYINRKKIIRKEHKNKEISLSYKAFHQVRY